MDSKRVSAGIAALIASGSLAVDVSVFDGKPMDKHEERIASELVTVEQKENVVEARAPWKGEAGLTIKYDLGETTPAERLADKRKKEVIYERVDFGDGGFKIDVLLNEKPDTNRFCYTVEGAGNYDFFYQPALTPEEIAEGAERPDDIVGSYAVYHKTLKNHRIGGENYATGKVMHIPRPQVWSMSDVDTKVWAELSYAEPNLCVTVPQDFLDKATYPVRVDPTFGYTSIGATGQFVVATNAVRGSYLNPSASTDGQVDSVSVYGSHDVADKHIKGMMLDTSMNLLTNGVSDAFVVSTIDEWQVATYTTKPTVTNGVSYYPAFVSEFSDGTNFFRFSYDSSSGTNSFQDSTNSYAAPQNIGTPTNSSNKYSIYATYTVSGGGGGATSTDDGIIWFN